MRPSKRLCYIFPYPFLKQWAHENGINGWLKTLSATAWVCTQQSYSPVFWPCLQALVCRNCSSVWQLWSLVWVVVFLWGSGSRGGMGFHRGLPWCCPAELPLSWTSTGVSFWSHFTGSASAEAEVWRWSWSEHWSPCLGCTCWCWVSEWSWPPSISGWTPLWQESQTWQHKTHK